MLDTQSLGRFTNLRERPDSRLPGILLRVERPLPPVGEAALLAWLTRGIKRSEPCLAWVDGASRQTLVGRGVALAVRLPGSASLHDLARACSDVTELVPSSGIDPTLPLAWLGASFDGDPGRGPWSGWPSAQLRVPELLLRGGARGWTAVAHAWVRSAQADARRRLTERLDGQIAELSGEPARSEGVDASLEPAAVRAPMESRASFERRVASALSSIAAGRLTKVVLARAVQHTLSPGWRFGAGETLARLHASNPSSQTFAWVEPDRSAFLGASPELLLGVEGLQVHTHALAGTTARAALDAPDLLGSEKDGREHATTRRAIEQALGPLCRELCAGDVRVKSLAALQHLETPLRGTLSERTSLLDLAARLHPTPAVGGWPRDRALDWLGASEETPRGWYAGPIGWVTPSGDGVLAVAIRSALLRDRRAWTFAGAGIVAGSDPAAEWRETELKLATAERALRARKQ